MNRFSAFIALSCALSWISMANADCMSDVARKDASNCTQTETSGDALDMPHAISGEVTMPLPTQTDPLTETHAVTPIAAAVDATNSNYRKVEICGTAQLVCD